MGRLVTSGDGRALGSEEPRPDLALINRLTLDQLSLSPSMLDPSSLEQEWFCSTFETDGKAKRFEPRNIGSEPHH